MSLSGAVAQLRSFLNGRQISKLGVSNIADGSVIGRIAGETGQEAMTGEVAARVQNVANAYRTVALEVLEK